MSSRRVVLLFAIVTVISLAAVIPVRADRGGSRLTRLSQRVDVLEDDVAALEAALPSGALTTRPSSISKSFEVRSTSQASSPIQRLKHRVARLEARVVALEDAVESPATRRVPRSAAEPSCRRRSLPEPAGSKGDATRTQGRASQGDGNPSNGPPFAFAVADPFTDPGPKRFSVAVHYSVADSHCVARRAAYAPDALRLPSHPVKGCKSLPVPTYRR